MSIIVRRTGEADLSLPGNTKLLGEASSRIQEFDFQWEEYRLWQTPEGKFVAGKAALSGFAVDLRQDKYQAEVFAKEEDVVKYFGLGDLAKDLYRKVGWRTEERVG